MTALRATARIGVLGGTFDPPHCGHLKLAEQAMAELEFDCVLLMPVHTAPHKQQERRGACPTARLEMCELAVQGLRGISASDIEVRRGGPSYTVDTLEKIHEQHPDARLTLILGADMARTLSTWRRPRRLLELAEVVVAERNEVSRGEVRDELRSLCADEGRLRFLTMAPIAISSSTVRERIAAGAPVDRLLPAGVAKYIDERHLYRDA